jgi:hypothetical protein
MLLPTLTLFFPQIPPQNLLVLHLREDSLSVVKHVPQLNGQLEGLVGIPAEAESCPSQEMYMLAYVGQSHAAHIAQLEVVAVQCPWVSIHIPKQREDSKIKHTTCISFKILMHKECTIFMQI